MEDYDDDLAAYMADDGPGEYDAGICPACEGSGEGEFDGAVCLTCRGRGEGVYGSKEILANAAACASGDPLIVEVRQKWDGRVVG